MVIHIDPVEAQSDEVTALKNTVREVAKRYAVQHNLCGVVDQALIEMGVGTREGGGDPTEWVAVDVEVSIVTTGVVNVRRSAFIGLTDAEQRAKITEAVQADLMVNWDLYNARTDRPEVEVTYRDRDPETDVTIAHVLCTRAENYLDPGRFIGGEPVPEGHVVRYVPGSSVGHLLYDRGNDGTTYHHEYARCGAGNGFFSEVAFVPSEARLCLRCARSVGTVAPTTGS